MVAHSLELTHKLEEMLKHGNAKLDAAVEFSIDDSILVRRITGRYVSLLIHFLFVRLIHKASGRTYHEDFQPPKVAGKDDVTFLPMSFNSRLPESP